MQDELLDQESRDDAILFSLNGDTTYVLSMLLADLQFNPTLHNNQALVHAVEHGMSGAVELLLADPRLNVEDRKRELIQLAIDNG